MTKLDYVPYAFEKNKVGVFCDKSGSGKIILEDIFKILYPNDWQEQLNSKLRLIESEVNIEIEFHNGVELHTTDETGIREVYSFCDDAPDEDLYKRFIKWLEEKLCYFLEIEKPKLGSIIPMLSVWDKEIEDLLLELPSDKVYEELTIKEWLKEKYKIETDWLCEIISKQIDNELASTYRSTTGSSTVKREGTNFFTRLNFVLVTPKTNKYLIDSDFSWFEKSLINSKNNDGKYYRYVSNYDSQVRQLLEKRENIDKIINIIWNKNPGNIEYSMFKVIVTLIEKRGI